MITLNITTSCIVVSVVYAECCGFNFVMLSLIVLGVIMLSVIMLSVIILSVIVPK